MAQRPTSVKVFGILNIVLGGFGVTCAQIGLGILLPLAELTPQLRERTFITAWTVATAHLSFLAAGALLAAGIGLLKLRPWARILSIVCACYAIVMLIIVSSLKVSLLWPRMGWAMERAEHARPVGIFVGLLAASCLGLAYPVLLLIFMMRRNVVAAFQQRAETPPEPTAGGGELATVLSGPSVVKTLGIMNIAIGALGVLFLPVVGPVSFLPDLYTGTLLCPALHVAPYLSWYLSWKDRVNLVVSVFLIVSGVGLIKKRGWGRILALGYGWPAIFAQSLRTAFTVCYLVGLLPRETRLPDGIAYELTVTWDNLLDALTLLVHPLLLLVFLTRPNVVAVFRPKPAPPPPTPGGGADAGS